MWRKSLRISLIWSKIGEISIWMDHLANPYPQKWFLHLPPENYASAAIEK